MLHGSPLNVLILVASLADSEDAEVWEPYPRYDKPKYDTSGVTNLDSELKSKGPYSQSYGLSSSHVWM